jgi:ABC-type polysaccharide/polyol phosphate transport system ATPase subunit
MTSIKVSNDSVEIPIYDVSARRSLKKVAMHLSVGGRLGSDAGHPVVVKALSNINLNLTTGDRLGLLGHNGAGKSTLLRVLAGIYEPTGGTVEVTGKVASLFDLGLGFNPEATGYDNIRIGGLYLGMSLREIEQKLPDIEEFSELGEFLDVPLRTYSQGMLARLSFAISTCVNPDILILDEGIAAGDASFMRRADDRMLALIKRSSILVVASHSTDVIASWCTMCAILERGRMTRIGPVAETVVAYTAQVLGDGAAADKTSGGSGRH